MKKTSVVGSCLLFFWSSQSTTTTSFINAAAIQSSDDSTPTTISTTSSHTSFSHSVLDRIGEYLSSALLPPTTNRSRSAWQDFSDFPLNDEEWAWGTTTLEVVKTSAIYLTRPAAFGPRITLEEGLQGTLIPISSFYRPPSFDSEAAHQDSTATQSSSELILNDGLDNHGCPVPDGPGWKDGSDENSESDSDWMNGGDWDVDISSAFYSELPKDSSKSLKTNKEHQKQKYTIGKPPSDFIALIERGGNCSFVEKVRLSQALGAIAVIIGGNGDGENGDDRRPVTMFGKDSKDIEIPSSFVTRGSYLDLLRLIEELKDSDGLKSTEMGLEIILSRTDLNWEYPLIDLGLLLLLLPSIMTVITLIVHRIKIIRQRRRDRAPKLSVTNLPCLIWRSDGKPWEKVDPNQEDEDDEEAAEGEGENSGSASRRDLESDGNGNSNVGPSNWFRNNRINGRNKNKKKHLESMASTSTSSASNDNQESTMTKASFGNECAICLEEFKDGDRIRLLPCGHIYHKVEIDDWLCRIKKLCPICKRDIMVPIPPAPPIQLQEAAEEEQQGEARNANQAIDESTPLLNPSTST